MILVTKGFAPTTTSLTRPKRETGCSKGRTRQGGTSLSTFVYWHGHSTSHFKRQGCLRPSQAAPPSNRVMGDEHIRYALQLHSFFIIFWCRMQPQLPLVQFNYIVLITKCAEVHFIAPFKCIWNCTWQLNSIQQSRFYYCGTGFSKDDGLPWCLAASCRDKSDHGSGLRKIPITLIYVLLQPNVLRPIPQILSAITAKPSSPTLLWFNVILSGLYVLPHFGLWWWESES